MQYFIGIDSSTTATKALLIDEQGDVVAVAATEYGYETPRPLWSEQDPDLWWKGAANSIRQVLAASGVKPDDVHGIGLTGQMHGLVLLDEDGEVLRPAILWNDQRTGAAVRRDPPPAGQAAADPDHRQRRADRLYRAQDPLGAAERARGVGARPPHPAAQGLRALQADRRLCHRQGRRRRHDPVRPQAARLVARGAGGARNSAGLSAADARRPGDHRLRLARSRRGDRAARRHPGHGRRRRPGGRRRGRRRGAAGHRVAGAGHVGRGLCHHGRPLRRAGGAPARLLPCRAGPLALYGRDALRGRQPALVPRHLCAGRRATTTCSPRPQPCRSAAKGCSSCPT